MTARMINAPAIQYVRIPDGTRIAYRELGDGPAVLLVHGWPTSSFLYRNVMPALAEHNRVVAIDLPGFGESDKPVDARYDFDFFERAIDAFLAAVGIDRVAIVGHDLGGPVVVHWALGRLERVTGIGLLNTLLYPEFSPAVAEFVTALMDPAGARASHERRRPRRDHAPGRVGPRRDHRRDRRRGRRAVPQRAGRARRWRGPATGSGSAGSSRSPPASARSGARSRLCTAPATRSCRTSARRSSDSSATCRMP